MRKNKTKRRLGNIIKVVFLGTVLLCLIGVMGVVAISIKRAPEIESFHYIETKHAPTKIYDEAGREIDQYKQSEWGEYATIDQIPKHLQEAVIVLEDENFYTHPGIDFKKIRSAIFNNLRNGSMHNGGTTITQQVIKENMVDGTPHKIMQKLQEQYLAIQLEKRYSKDQILEWYLNETGFGQGTIGVKAAASRYFGKNIRDLSLTECAVIAVIPEYPTKYNPILNPENNWEKASICLNKLLEAGYITAAEKEEAIKENPYERMHQIQKEYEVSSTHSYFVEAAMQQVREDLKTKCGYTDLEASSAIYNGGLQIDTTLDLNAQRVVDQSFNEQSKYLKDAFALRLEYSVEVGSSDGNTITKEAITTVKSYEEIEPWVEAQKQRWGIQSEDIIEENLIKILQPQISFVLMNYTNGEVKALYGGSGDKVNLGFNYATQSLRMPGEAFHILAAYAPGLDMGRISKDSVLEDTKTEIKLDSGRVYSPKNMDGKYNGSMTLEEVICNPRSAVAMKVVNEKVGVDKAFEYLQKFGFGHLDEANDKHIALVQGALTKGVTTLELNAAYSAIANGGVYIKPRLYREVRNAQGEVILKNEPETTHVIKEKTAQLLTNMLQKSVEQGHLQRIKKYPHTQEAAAMMGISSQQEDMMLTGYMSDYSGTMWIGYSDPETLTEEGKDYEVNTWAKIMSQICK